MDFSDCPPESARQLSTGSSHGNAAIPERYRKIFQYSNDAILIVDFEVDEFVDVNPAACELLGYSREQLLELRPQDIHPDDIDRVYDEFLDEIRTSGSGWTDDMECLTNEAETVPTEVSGAVLETPDDEHPTQMVAILRDISDRVARREALEDTVQQLERFAQVLSHDLRNPLNIGQGRLELARETGAAEHFDAVAEAFSRMDELIDNLLVLTQEGAIVGDIAPVDLDDVGRQAWRNVDAANAICEIETGLEILADESRVQELLENLLQNAIRHGGPGVEITVGALETEDDTGFYIADDGPGIPPADRESVLEWGVSSDDNGTGFGLVIVRQIVSGHGWQIDVAERESGGACFEISGVTVQ